VGTPHSLSRLLFLVGLAATACGLTSPAPLAPTAAPPSPPAAPAVAPAPAARAAPPALDLGVPEATVRGAIQVPVTLGGAGARLTEATLDGRPLPPASPLAIDTRGLPDGSHTLSVTARGDGGSQSATAQIVSDNTAPTVAMEAKPVNVGQGKVLIVRVVPSEPLSQIQGWIDGAGVYFAEDEGAFWAVYSYGPDARLGPRRVDVQVTDLAGNTGGGSVAFNVVKTNFPIEYITLEPGRETLLAPALVNAELAKLDAIWARFTPEKRWTGPWIIPAEGPVTDVFGSARSYNGGPVGGHHLGHDIGAWTGTPVFAANGGVVVLAEPLVVRGNTVILDHGYGIYTMYNHLSEIGVTVGQALVKGEFLGKTGDTGLVTGPHLHWEAHVHIEPIDPLVLVRGPLP
jgi:murein DD-endopeptidase MepM/ murein hydrolase activator NlpD